MPFRWRFHPEDLGLQERIARASRVSSLAARLLVNRGIRTAEEASAFLRVGLGSLTDPYAMAHMERAVDRILKALKGREPIVVYGDSDMDGVAGTALLTSFLRRVGGDVSTYLPNRLVEGYSLTEAGLAEIRRRGAKLVLTVDNGTTANARIAELRAGGCDVIVIDHHEPGAELPDAYALLNPKWDGCGYPFRYLCGTGVAFQLLSGLAARLPARGAAADAITMLLRDSIALVALATICDCVPLVGENRALARAGLIALSGSEHPGLRALKELAGVGRTVHSTDVSFRIGPRINAAGRLGQAPRALALLLCESLDESRAIARELDERNGERQQLEAEITVSARRLALESGACDEPAIVLRDPSWHAGVVGIVAARLAAEFQKPTVLVAMNGPRGRGSGRSARGFDLHAALTACAQHLVGFGGHAFAAGLEVEEARFPAFREALLEQARRQAPAQAEAELLIDAEIPLGALTPALMADLDRLSPYGEGLAVPVFAVAGAEVDGDVRRFGRNQHHVSFSLAQSGVKRRAVAYHVADAAAALLRPGARCAVAFTPRLNVFRGQASVELEVRDFRHAHAQPA